MAKQLSFFDAIGATVLDAAQHEKNVQDNKRKAAIRATKLRQTIEKPKVNAPIIEEKQQPKKALEPTWEVHFFDGDGRQRIDWQRAKDEATAKVRTLKDWGAKSKVFYVAPSKRTLEEIEALD